MSDLLKRWNLLSMPEAERDILACGGSRAWARGMANRRPIANETALLTASERGLSKPSADWRTEDAAGCAGAIRGLVETGAK